MYIPNGNLHIFDFSGTIGPISFKIYTHSVTLDRFRKLHLDEVRIGRGLPSEYTQCILGKSVKGIQVCSNEGYFQ